MTDHYKTLGLEAGAKQAEIEAAFEECLAARKVSRRGTSDLHAAFAVLSDPALRKAYNAIRGSQTASAVVTEAASAVVRQAKDAADQIDVQELARDTRRLALKGLVITGRFTERLAEATAKASRSVHLAASRQLENES